MSSSRLSAFVITHNEERNLAECLGTLDFCDEVIVLDHASIDGTLAIARQYGAHTVQVTDWPGFGPQKQRALDLTSGRWVLSIDADERITPDLRHSILAAVSEESSVSGYEIHRMNYFLGKRMRFGGWGSDFPLRLARRDSCHFSSDIVHERLIVRGQIGRLAAPMAHYSYRNLSDILEKQSKYALAGASKRESAGKRGGVSLALMKSSWAFFRAYVLLLGFLDGAHGLLAAVSRSQETFWKYAGVRLPKE